MKDFVLPHIGNDSGDLLLWAIFDLIRNGIAHQYQQIIVNIKNRKKFFIELTGASEDRYLQTVRASRPATHLDYYLDQDGDLGIKVYPEILFLDVEEALQKISTISQEIQIQISQKIDEK